MLTRADANRDWQSILDSLRSSAHSVCLCLLTARLATVLPRLDSRGKEAPPFLLRADSASATDATRAFCRAVCRAVTAFR
jgi:hypothetical protein